MESFILKLVRYQLSYVVRCLMHLNIALLKTVSWVQRRLVRLERERQPVCEESLRAMRMSHENSLLVNFLVGMAVLIIAALITGLDFITGGLIFGP